MDHFLNLRRKSLPNPMILISVEAHQTLYTGTTRPSSQEVNLDELPYDLENISMNVQPKFQNERIRKYLIGGPYRPPPGFQFPQSMIAGCLCRLVMLHVSTYA
jgi:hypothetical protein